jgi:hypothetical protein
VRLLLRSRVAPGTPSTYDSLIKTHKEAGFDEATYGGLPLRIVRNTTTRSDYLGNLISAVRQALEADGAPSRSAEAAAGRRELLRGRRNVIAIDVDHTVPRGAVTEAMLDQLLKWLPSQGITSWEVFSYLVAWCTGVRSCQLGDLWLDDFKDDGAGGFKLETVKRHDPTASQRDKQPLMEQTVHPRLFPHRRKLKAGAGRGAAHYPAKEALVSEWCNKAKAVKLSALIRQAAAALHWTQRLQFPGIHCVRHGLAAALGPAAAGAALGHGRKASVSATTRRYAQTQAARLQRARQ